MWTTYEWIVVAGAFAAVFMAYGIGANDVANAFATSVGSRSLRLWQAVILAGIFEFGGAVLLGRGVTSTIKSSIIDGKKFASEPELLMYGMLCALLAAGTWLIVATYLEMPVSTTHSIIGGIVGFALASKGTGSVDWYSTKPSGVRIQGIAAIVASWFISPICSGIIAIFLFGIVRTFVLRAPNAYRRVFIFFPILVFFTLWVNLFYVLNKGVTKQVASLTYQKCAWISAITAAAVGVITACCMPFLKKMIDNQADQAAAITAGGVMLSAEEAKEAGVKTTALHTDGDKAANMEGPTGKSSSWFAALSEGVQHDVHGVIETDERVTMLHAHAELFDPKAESGFRFLQIFTACCNSFAHGANDVANAIGPFAAIYEIYRTGKISSKSDVPIWILVLGGGGIVVGLATYGYNIIRAIGIKMVKITPSRGFAIELSAALVIVTGSRLELPLSTTHCVVGATVAVGMLEHGAKGVNWPIVAKSATGWVLTLIIVGLISALLMACGIYTPNIHSAELNSVLHKSLNTTALGQVDQLRVCTAADFQANLDQTEAWVIGTSKDLLEPGRIFDASAYTTALYESNVRGCMPTFEAVPAIAAALYPVK